MRFNGKLVITKMSKRREVGTPGACEWLELRRLLSGTLFTIDPTHSTLSLNGHVSSYQIAPQGNGSLFTTYSGKISAVLSAGKIQFDSLSNITANNNGNWQPGGTPGNYGGETDNIIDVAYETVRNLVMNLQSSALTVAGDGSFGNAGQTFTVTTGQIDYADGINGEFTGDMAGTGSSNNAGSTSSYKVANGVATLTIPVNLLLTESVFENADTQLNLSGSLVATAKVTTPATGSIAGNVFNDANANATKDAGETGLAGWKLFLDTNKNAKLDSGETTATTDSAGAFKFSNLAAGAYRIVEVINSGYRLTTPTANAIDVSLGSGQAVTGKLFGDSKLGLISGAVFKDANANGTRESAEVGFAGQTVFLDLNKNGKLDAGEAKATTNSTGAYVFPAVAVGTYVVTHIVPSGFRLTAPATKTFTVSVAAGQSITGKLFGDTAQGQISGSVFKDANGNGVRESAETGFATITLYLDLNKNAKLDTGEPNTKTTSSGTFVFPSVAPGTHVLREVVPAGYRITTPAAKTFSVTVAAAQIVTGKVFGDTQRGQISGSIFKDSNGNGVRESSETAFANQTVFLDLNKNGKPDAGESSVKTDASGNYLFAAVVPGTYVLTQVVPAGYRITTPATKTFNVTLAAAQIVTGKVFGDTQNVLITGNVFRDTNGNLKQDGGEAGLANWRIFIDANKDGIYQTSEKSVLSSSTGAFIFSNLPAGSFVVRAVQQTGYSRTTPTSGSYIFALTSGQTKAGLLFGEKA